MKIHHIGYLVKNIEKAEKQFQIMGYEREGNVVYDPLRNIDILFMINDGYRIELVCPKTNDSVVADTLKKLGVTPYHLCYYCDDIASMQEEMRGQGFTPAGEIQPAVAMDGKNVCFLYNRHVGIIELVER